ncbi:ABC transporter permease [Streptomyces sp. NPDC001714]|uniref:ABC transporter permease n=1 Tax=Streptomyces sp. NPDC001714 TaxID=3364603 RepID=UPI0036C14F0B
MGRVQLLRWLARRLCTGVLVVWGAATVAFAALHMVPGDPVVVLLGGSTPSSEVVAQTRHELGYDRPVTVQYFDYLGHLARGDLGQSFQLHQPVGKVIAEQLWPTAQLTAVGFTLALAGALVLALAGTGHPVLRRVGAGLELLMISAPGFWVGVLLLSVFSFRLGLFPVVSGDSASGLVLPAVTLALGLMGTFAQVMREGLDQVLTEPFVLSSRARGSTETTVRLRHALRHALLPVITLSGWVVGALLGGSVLVETIFSRQGIGRVMAGAITGRDLPLVTGIAVVSAVVFTLANIAVDLLYRVVDPRLREVAP